MVINAAVQMLREADELKQKILKFKSGTSMLQERSLWTTQQELQKVYQNVLVLDLDYALDKKVEQDLWNIGFKQQIEVLQAISKDRKNPLRSEGQAMLSWVLQAAAGFYLCLLHQICTAFKLDLPFRRRASLLGLVEGWGTGPATGALPPAAAARYICQHCLIHLGDLARYRQQLRVANTFYRQALAVSAHSGQPYNQLALVWWRRRRRLGALYWHVRSLLVRAPFPPAHNNLAHTLRAALSRENSNVPVLLGIKPTSGSETAVLPPRLDSHSYVTYLLRAIHNIHSLEDLESTPALVQKLNSALTALVATDSFESMTLIKMACVLIWVVQTTREGLRLPLSALSEEEREAARLAELLAHGALLALLLPNYTGSQPLPRTLPALKVWLEWIVCNPVVLSLGAFSRAQLWPALAHALNQLASVPDADTHHYATTPLPEDCELLGFTPLEQASAGLVFPHHAVWDSYADRLPTVHDKPEISSGPLTGPGEHRLRARRLLTLGTKLSQLRPEHLAYTEEDGILKFTATLSGDECLSEAIAEAVRARGAGGAGEGGDGGGGGEGGSGDDEDSGEDDPPPPLVISEADFREKVREKRLGILKPQGSLERAREERALATQEDQDPDSNDEASKSEEKKEARKPRVNIAMAAIMRKQEETNKQVKFVTPPPTPDSTTSTVEPVNKDKPKIIQPKPIKSLANLPTGRKTGGILSLKDKSAGYPHLVNATEPEPKKPEKEDKKEMRLSQQNLSQNSQNYQQKRQEPPPLPIWNNNPQNIQNFNESPRLNFQKNYGIQTNYNPNYQQNVNPQGIRLPVVNPKEIDVRTAALQKQSSRQDMYPDGNKFNNYQHQVSGDKKNFMNDLPPRFANQYRYWNVNQESDGNKFRDDSFKQGNASFSAQPQRPNWANPQETSYQQIPSWWKPDQAQPNFNYIGNPVNMQSNWQQSPNVYQPYCIQNQGIGQQKEMMNQVNYLPQSQGQHQQVNALQNLVSSPNINSPTSFNSYAPAPVGYDAAMYPQFANNMAYPPPQMKMQPDKGNIGYHGNQELRFGANVLEMQQRNVNFNEGSHVKSMEQMRGVEGLNSEAPVNTYSLFSGAQDSGWSTAQPQPHQSLWSGPGPSPLERLLEQQKQLKQPPTPQ